MPPALSPQDMPDTTVQAEDNAATQPRQKCEAEQALLPIAFAPPR